MSKITETISYRQKALSNCLSLKLNELGIGRDSNYVKREQIENLKDLIFDLVTCTPTDQSHVGQKFRSFSELNRGAKDVFISSLISKLGINERNVFLYASYSSQTTEKNNLHDNFIKCTDEILCLRCDEGEVVHSLYRSFRNALAHGNILTKDDYFILYSVDSGKDEKIKVGEYELPIKFFMRIKNIEKLMAFQEVLESYR